MTSETAEVIQRLKEWFGALPCDSVGKEHWDGLVEIVVSALEPIQK